MKGKTVLLNASLSANPWLKTRFSEAVTASLVMWFGYIRSQPRGTPPRGFREKRGGLLGAEARESVADGGSQESDPLELGGVEVLGDVLVGVDSDVGPVVEVEHRDPEGAVAEDLMVASEVEPLDLRDEVLLRAFR